MKDLMATPFVYFAQTVIINITDISNTDTHLFSCHHQTFHLA